MSRRVAAASHVATAVSPQGFPREGLAEVAFLGRSNAGKSSLLNALVGRRELARVSSTPGKTRAIHFYAVEREGGARKTRRLLFVDLPGYGFARVSKSERADWRRLVESYLEDRPALRAAVLIHDVRRDVSDDERDLVAWLAERGVPVLVAITKCDKLGAGARAARLRRLAADYQLGDRVLATAAPVRLGVEALWKAIDALVTGGDGHSTP
jgi:GTP-binding protein